MSENLTGEELFRRLESDLRLYHIVSQGLFAANADHLCSQCSRFAAGKEKSHGWLSQVSENLKAAAGLTEDQKQEILVHTDYFSRLVRVLPTDECEKDQMAEGNCKLKACTVSHLTELLSWAKVPPKA